MKCGNDRRPRTSHSSCARLPIADSVKALGRVRISKPPPSPPPRACRDFTPLSLQPFLALSCCLQRMVSAAEAPSVRRVELGVGCVLSFLLVIREHAVLRRSLCATLTALIDPLAAPSGAIAYDLTPCPMLRAEVMSIGLLGLRLDRPGVQGRDPGAQRVQVRHRSRSFVRRDLRGTHCARPFEGSRCPARRRPRDSAPDQSLRSSRPWSAGEPIPA